MIPISRWEDLTDNVEAVEALREVYGDDVEKLDLLVGLMAEKKIKGFAISETAFFIFVIMASRYTLNSLSLSLYEIIYIITNLNNIKRIPVQTPTFKDRNSLSLYIYIYIYI